MAFMRENNHNVFYYPSKSVPKKDKSKKRFHAEPDSFRKFNGTNECLMITHKRFLLKYVIPFFESIFHDFKGAAIEVNQFNMPELVLCFDPRKGEAPEPKPGDTVKKFTALKPIVDNSNTNDTAAQIAVYNNMSTEKNNTAYKLTLEAEQILSDFIYTDNDYEPNYYLDKDKLMVELPDQPANSINNYGYNKYNIQCAVRGISLDLVCKAIFGGNSKDGIIDYIVCIASSRSMYDQSVIHVLSINRCYRNTVKELVDDIGINVPISGTYDFVTVD